MTNTVEQNKTVRLLKAESRRSSSSSGSYSYAAGASAGAPIIRKPISIRSKSKQTNHSKGRKIKILDADGEVVTPRPLTHSARDAKRSLFFLEELKEQFQGSSSTSETDLGRSDVPSRHSVTNSLFVDKATTQGTTGSLSLAPEESLSVFELQKPATFQHEEAESVTEVTEEMLDELVHICLRETETISLLDIPSHVLPHDTEGAEELKESNRRYIELCKGKPGNEKYVEREMQTLDDAPKTTGTQTDPLVTADTDSVATSWDIYDSMNELTISTAVLENENTDSAEKMVRTLSDTKRSLESNSTTGSGSTAYSSLPDLQCNVHGPEPQAVLNSEQLLHSLKITERSVVANIYKNKLAIYKGLAILPDTDEQTHVRSGSDLSCTEASVPELQDEESTLRPALNLLWSFSCELTAGCEATSISWHKQNTNILAVGYNNSAHSMNTPGLICVWSLNNIKWPERVIYSHSVVTSVDFSPNVPAHLGVGMMDGTVAIYNVADRRCVASSSQSFNRHLARVCLVSWSKQVLVSISVDGLIQSWLMGSKNFECRELFQLKTVKDSKKELAVNKKKSDTGGVSAGLCFHFHPEALGVYLAGTTQGLIHMCSYSNRDNSLEKFQKHSRPVNSVAWSPFSPDLFLSGSSDGTVQLWRRDSPRPVLGFSSSETTVFTVHWSPKWPTVFAALKAEQLEIWDLKMSTLDPTVVLGAPESAELTSVQFCPDTDAVVLGDSHGEVTVHQLQNLGLNHNGQLQKRSVQADTDLHRQAPHSSN